MRLFVFWVLAGLVGCSENDAATEPDGASGSSASGSSGTSGGGTAGSTGGSATGGSGTGGTSGTGTGGTGTSGGSAGSAGSGGSAGGSGDCGTFTTFDDGATPTREIFLDASASGPGDGSADAPYVELEDALAELTPGTALRIRPGTYAGGAFESGLAGTEAAPIWIGGVPGMARPVLSGGANAIQLSSASYLVLHDLEITGQEANGLNIDDGGTYPGGASHHLVFRRLFVHDIGSGGNQDCLKLSGVDDFFVLESEFHGCSGGSAIDHVGCHRGVIAQNEFVELGGNGVQSKGGSDDILITRNRFLDAGERAVNMGGSTGFEFFRPALVTSGENFEARNVRVLSNLFRGGVSPVAFVGCVDCVAANNTIVDPERWIARILQETTSTAEYTFAPARGGRFSNNAVYFASAGLSTAVNVGGNTDAPSFEFSNNLWFAHDAPGESEPSSLPSTETGGIYGEDPAFASVATDEVSIDATSPLAGAGLGPAGVAGDLDGECYADPPSIGALEVRR
ncbi:MAG TPA: right-handed parallel beta-helix repeat-containing protein [Polyangiaceae bacterium]